LSLTQELGKRGRFAKVSKFKPIDFSCMNTYSLAERKSKVLKADFAKAWQKGDCFKDFLDNVPDILPIIFSYEPAHRASS
jgi:hypothetical protein